ncbi:MAG: FHA domain-containing protein [Polyangiaceae bacterium]|nr:FHA domain-containing protein [Polyangiaceae bacterium]MCW5791603.1 FHA domain-containing protein [Polyangiaceae bacterium]
MRFRLRFLLQEIDLHPGVTTLGRSADCRVSLDDPLVSREHAQLTVRGDRVVLEDLGSRNGTLLNGERTTGACELRDNDRIRLGAQEFVFLALDVAEGASSRTTGFLTRCASCGVPYAAEAVACVNCGSTEREEDTVTQVRGNDENWMLQLVLEVLQRAEVKQRPHDVERLLAQARANVEGRLAGGAEVFPEHLDALALAAVRLARHLKEQRWLDWALELHVLARRWPSAAFVAELASPELASLELQALTPGALREWLARLAEVAPPDSERQRAALALGA